MTRNVLKIIRCNITLFEREKIELKENQKYNYNKCIEYINTNATIHWLQ